MIELLFGVATGFIIGAFIAYSSDEEWHIENSGWGSENNSSLGTGSGKGVGDFLRWSMYRGFGISSDCGIWCWLFILLVAMYIYKKVEKK